jgi:hypothetical protein
MAPVQPTFQKHTKSIPEKQRGVIGEERILDKQKDRLTGGLSLHLLYAVYANCGCNALLTTFARSAPEKPGVMPAMVTLSVSGAGLTTRE